MDRVRFFAEECDQMQVPGGLQGKLPWAASLDAMKC